MQTEKTGRGGPRSEETRTGQAKTYIRGHFAENLNRDRVADHVCVTPNYLSRVFCRESGISLREYINLCRIEEAKRLITDPGKSLTWIAFEVGFESAQYFSTVFKRTTGVSPYLWRIKCAEGAGSEGQTA